MIWWVDVSLFCYSVQRSVTIQVQKGSAYAHLNGQVFDVVEVVGTRVTVKIDGANVDFYNTQRLKEVKIMGVE